MLSLANTPDKTCPYKINENVIAQTQHLPKERSTTRIVKKYGQLLLLWDFRRRPKILLMQFFFLGSINQNTSLAKSLIIKLLLFLVVREKEFLYSRYFYIDQHRSVAQFEQCFLREKPQWVLYLYILTNSFSGFMLIQFVRYFLKTFQLFRAGINICS